MNKPLLAGVVGHPITHSKSPKLHSYWLKKYNIQGHYVPIDLSPKKFEEGINSLILLGFKGVNVTIPHKEAALHIAHEVSDSARKIGAANTLYFRNGKIIADNTDAYGFMENLRQNAPDWRASSGAALVLGAGGAARAIIYALLKEGAPAVKITNRTKEKAEILAQHFGDNVEVIDWNSRNECVQSVKTLVNTTSLGMTGQPDLDISLSNADCLVTDIVYNPLQTALFKQAKDNGLMTVDGLGMLLHQAVPGFQGWFGHKPEVDAALRKTVLEA